MQTVFVYIDVVPKNGSYHFVKRRVRQWTQRTYDGVTPGGYFGHGEDITTVDLLSFSYDQFLTSDDVRSLQKELAKEYGADLGRFW